MEAGYAYGEVFTTPRLLRVLAEGRTETIAQGDNPPWNGATWSDGSFYVAEGGERDGGRILRIDASGAIEPLAEGLPSLGDHHTDGPAVGPDGWVYFGQGTATNSAVVGLDNRAFGWMERHADFHDVPCQDVVLRGVDYGTRDPSRGGRVHTGAYSAYGTPTEAGQRIEGSVPCNGAILRVRPFGGDVELVAWGMRNPFGLAFAPDGRLFVTDNGYDVRGSRPVFGSGDWLWEVTPGAWYGWPDYADGDPLGPRYRAPWHKAPRSLLAELPGTPPKPTAIFASHASANGIDFSREARFGHVGEAFVATFGDMAPGVGKVLHPVGFQVVRVDVATGRIEEFASNEGPRNGPASRLGSGGLERPVAVRFDPDGTSLYVVDFGVLRMEGPQPQPMPGTGVLWRIWHE